MASKEAKGFLLRCLWREEAGDDTACDICSLPMLADENYYFKENDSGAVHARCLWEGKPRGEIPYEVRVEMEKHGIDDRESKE